MEAIKTSRLTRKFNGLKAVDAISISVEKDEIFGFLGLNGAGKTTTVRMLTTILPPTAGSAKVYGHSIRKEMVEVRKAIGVVFEDASATQPDWTPMEYLEYFGAISGLDDKETKKRSLALLEEMELYDARERTLKTLSAGMAKRVEICRALLSRPKVLFLDEPTKELDIPGKRYIWDMLKKLKEEEVTIFLSSHDVREIEVLCDTVSVIHKGKVVHSGDASELKGKGGMDELEDRVIKLLRGDLGE